MTLVVQAAVTVPADADVLAVPVWLGGEVPPDTPAELDLGWLAARGFEGKVGDVETLMADDGSTLIAIGIGLRENVTAEVLRRAAASVVRAAWKAHSGATTLLDALPAGADLGAAAQAVAEGALLASYTFGRYKSDAKTCRLHTLAIVGGGTVAGQGVARGVAVAGAVWLARDLSNEPAGQLTPTRLAEVARDTARRHNLVCHIWDAERIRAERLGGLAGVAAGSEEPPRLIELLYEPPGATTTVVLVGKGITFDSGGLSLKTPQGMMAMKTDMSGGAAVIAAMSVLPALGVKVRVIGLVPATENLPSGRAIKPGDVLTIRNGTTVEVLNTDAEGRLILADALSLAVERQPAAIIDLATLTGACVVALGPKYSGLFGTDDQLIEAVRAAAGRAGEKVWHLPLPSEYRKDIDSDVADIKNMGSPAGGGAIAAGLFLREFVGDVPWVHLDIAGPSRAEADDGHIAKGSTGVGVATLVELLRTWPSGAKVPPSGAPASPSTTEGDELSARRATGRRRGSTPGRA